MSDDRSRSIGADLVPKSFNKAVYIAPKLSSFGSMRILTRNGSGSVTENKGSQLQPTKKP
jgi:hypothetical protein